MNSLEFRSNIPEVLGPLKPAFGEYSAVFLSTPIHQYGLVFREERSLTAAALTRAARVSKRSRTRAGEWRERIGVEPISGFSAAQWF